MKSTILLSQYKLENPTTNDDIMIGSLMKNNLKCSICNNIMVLPTVCNCSHSFCNYCIINYTKNNQKCPICNKDITSPYYISHELELLCCTIIKSLSDIEMNNYLEKVKDHKKKLLDIGYSDSYLNTKLEDEPKSEDEKQTNDEELDGNESDASVDSTIPSDNE